MRRRHRRCAPAFPISFTLLVPPDFAIQRSEQRRPTLLMKLAALRLSALAVLAAAGANSLCAQYLPPPPPRPFPGFVNEHLRNADPYMNAWDIAASFRVRIESK